MTKILLPKMEAMTQAMKMKAIRGEDRATEGRKQGLMTAVKPTTDERKVATDERKVGKKLSMMSINLSPKTQAMMQAMRTKAIRGDNRATEGRKQWLTTAVNPTTDERKEGTKLSMMSVSPKVFRSVQRKNCKFPFNYNSTMLKFDTLKLNVSDISLFILLDSIQFEFILNECFRCHLLESIQFEYIHFECF